MLSTIASGCAGEAGDGAEVQRVLREGAAMCDRDAWLALAQTQVRAIDKTLASNPTADVGSSCAHLTVALGHIAVPPDTVEELPALEAKADELCGPVTADPEKVD